MARNDEDLFEMPRLGHAESRSGSVSSFEFRSVVFIGRVTASQVPTDRRGKLKRQGITRREYDFTHGE